MPEIEARQTLLKLNKIVTMYGARLRQYPNVTGTGYGLKIKDDKIRDEYCITVYVDRKISEKEMKEDEIIPKKFMDFPTDVIQANFRAYADNRTEKLRPARPGCSIGHYNVTAGTFGLLTRDRETRELMILSNNHVLADSNDGLIRDPILQPGTADGGEFLEDAIARLWRFVPIKFQYRYQAPEGVHVIFEGSNIVDCAIAKPLDSNEVRPEIIDIGIPRGVVTPQVGMTVQKSGRTTGHTQGRIVDVEVVEPIRFGGGRTAIFQHQIVIKGKGFSDGGDSGSCILDNEGNAVALLFAGYEEFTIANNMKTVLDCLDVDPVLQA